MKNCQHLLPYSYAKTDLMKEIVCRSIQKLEELNVGMDDLGEEVQALSLQCNGGEDAAGKSSDVSLPQVEAGLSSSTPQRTGERAAITTPAESPVLQNRFSVIHSCFTNFNSLYLKESREYKT